MRVPGVLGPVWLDDNCSQWVCEILATQPTASQRVEGGQPDGSGADWQRTSGWGAINVLSMETFNRNSLARPVFLPGTVSGRLDKNRKIATGRLFLRVSEGGRVLAGTEQRRGQQSYRKLD
ncbi:hypothetical protein AK812_SmicGene27405 [Symbiodinium microadriaticum]|uniref:Uncharacterized protein n=1 Tax=Symbiodinium microadriaticum TaxID=2951 RepID=A0A1Q9D6Y4_SYMMI|nr:hypothetical protein AK812_SmicGene27405 [Symbiodinium microadriaticum]